MSDQSYEKPLSWTNKTKKEQLKYYVAPNVCSNHPDAQIVADQHTGDSNCRECGTVIGINYDSRPEQFKYDDGEKDPTRVGHALSDFFEGQDLTTEIMSVPGRNKSNTNGKIPYKSKNKMSIKMMALKRFMTYIDQIEAFHHLTKDIIDEAKSIYAEIEGGKKVGIHIKSASAGSVYIACAKKDVPRALYEVAQMFKMKKPKLRQGVCAIITFLQIFVRFAKPIQIIDRICSQLELSKEMVAFCRHLCQKVEDIKTLDQLNTEVVVGTAIFTASHILGSPKSVKDISQFISIEERDITAFYKKFVKPRIETMIPEKFLNDYQQKRLPL